MAYKTKIKDVGTFMQTCRDRYTAALDADRPDRTAAEEDVDFVAGNQWRQEAFDRRVKFKQPVLTWNRLPTFVAQVSNTGRENKPAIKTTPMDGGKKETAEFFQSRIRHCEYESDADTAYDTARRQQIVSGRGFIRVATEYKPGKTFEQSIAIEPIENQFSVLFDPTAHKYDRSDADYCFVFSWVSKDTYERRYGKKTAAAAANFFAKEVNPAPDWMGVGKSGDLIQVAEYWLKKHTPRALCDLGGGITIYRDELPKNFDDEQIVDERDEDVITVCQYIVDGVEPLDETEFLVPFIPIAPLWGESQIVNGRRENYSLVRFVKDPQRLVNLYVSNIAGEIARMPKTPYIVAVGQILGREEEWETINDEPRSVVQYHAKDVNGTLVGPPQREISEPPIQALTLGLNQAIDAMKAGMGIFDSSLGARSNEQSGTAIERRKQQSNITNYHFADNEARTRKYIGRIVLALIIKLDGAGPKEVPTRSEEGKTSLVKVGQPYLDPATGQQIHHDLAAGSYDIAVSTGPTNASQREEAFQTYSEIARADKSFMPIAGDLLFRNSDAPGSDQIADRYEKMLPPQLKPPDPNQNGQRQMQQAQQALQQMGQQHEQLVGQLHQASQIIEQKQAEQQAKVEIARMQEETKRLNAQLESATRLAIAEITTKAQDATRLAADALARDRMAHEAALDTTAHAVDAAHKLSDQQHATGMAGTGQQHAVDMQQLQQDHATGLQQSAQDAAAQQQQQQQQPEPQE